MPSVFTIEGTDAVPEPRRKKRRGLGEADLGPGCKWVKNSRTGCEIQLCPVPKSESRTGWKFMKGTSRCPTRRR
jgi:hypothetical protein